MEKKIVRADVYNQMPGQQGRPLGAGRRCNLIVIQDFWLKGRSCNMGKLGDDHILGGDGERRPSILNARSVQDVLT